jgi:hypothetical protein
MATGRIECAADEAAAERRASALRNDGFTVKILPNAIGMKNEVDTNGNPINESIIFAGCNFLIVAWIE